jgi:Mg2+ and Co2+ transporter CorA
MKQELQAASIERFEFLAASRDYVSDLWQMTIEYVEGTLKLLESLYSENTQRELNTLKYITLVGVLTGFFGMNIAFPWEERWSQVSASSLSVVVLIGVAAVIFYFFLRYFIHNRRFTINKNK